MFDFAFYEPRLSVPSSTVVCIKGTFRWVSAMFAVLLCLLCLLNITGPVLGYFPEERWSPESPLLAPRVVIALICRNSAHSLPYFLGTIERLNYPKDRIALW